MSAAARTEGAARLQLRVARIEQLFDPMDPALFRERDLDPRAETFVVEWARAQEPGRALSLAVCVDDEASPADADALQAAVSGFFRQRARATRLRLRALLRDGRISLAIGIAFVAVALVGADLAGDLRYGILRESLVIGGWVALWRPLEIFLYDWWPIRAEARFYDRLAAMPVELVARDGDARAA